MSDAAIIEPFGVPEIFVDGFDEHEMQGHVISCLGFRHTKAGKIAVVRLTFPAESAPAAIEQAKAALASERQIPVGLIAAVTSKVAN